MPDYLIFTAPVALIIAVILIINRKAKNNSHYDERQLIARSAAYKCAFAALSIYFIFSELAVIFSDKEWCTPECNIGLGILISIGVFTSVSIAKDAYTPTAAGGKGMPGILIILLIGALQLYLGIFNIIKFGITHDGLLNIPVTFCVGCLMIVVVLTQLIKSAFDRKAVKDDD